MTGSVSKLSRGKQPLQFQVPSFITGLNKAVGSYYVRDTDIVDAKNVEINLGGAIAPRLGMTRYDDASSEHFDTFKFIRNGHRYSRSDGNAEIVFNGTNSSFTANDLYADDGTEVFKALSIATILRPGDDHKVRFEQWKDTLYISSRKTPLISYNRGGFGSVSGDTRLADLAGIMHPTVNLMFQTTVFNSGETGFLATNKWHSYRFTVDRYHGNEFLGESIPLYYIRTDSGGNNKPEFQIAEANPTDVGGIRIYKHNSFIAPTTNFFTDAKFINIYRSAPVDSNPPDRETLGASYYWLDAIPTEDFLNAANGDIIYTDDGSVEFDASKPIVYFRLTRPPQSKFIRLHKNRLWFANIEGGEYKDGEVTSLTTYFSVTLDDSPSRIYYSELNEPESLRLTNFFDVGGDDGEGITALESFDNKLLIAFKPNSMWGVFGGDFELTSLGDLDISISAIDRSVGCIAPETVSYGEGGMIWLSNKGVYFYDGTKPVPLRSELIDSLLANLPPHRKQFAVGQYSQNRKYILSFTDSTVDSEENKVSLEFDFRTKTWTRKTFGNSTVYGVNGYLEAKRGDEAGKVYALLHTTNSAVGAVQTLGDVQYDIDPDEGVAWSFKTKHFDCGDADAIKQFRTIIVRLNHTSPVTIDYDIDDGCTTGTLTLTPLGCSGSTTTAHTWDETGLNWMASAGQDLTHVWGGAGAGGAGTQQNYVINVATSATPNPKGRRIQFEFSGTANTQGQEFQGLTILYVTEPRVGNA